MASDPNEATPPVMDLASDQLAAGLELTNPMSITLPTAPLDPLSNAAYLAQRRKKKAGLPVKRSSSTPAARGDTGMSMADKRRNKLGYHRTSVACGKHSSNPIHLTVTEVFTQDTAAGERYGAWLRQMIQLVVVLAASD